MDSFEQQAISAAVDAAYPQCRQTLFTVEQFATAQPAFTAASLRNHIFRSTPRTSSKGIIQGNGLIECGAIIRIGRRVLIDEDKFLEWVYKQNGSAQ